MTRTATPLSLLDGVVVLDWTEGVAGPSACQMLGDMGADVIKVERPEGDWGRPMGGGPWWGGHHFRALNRNKRGLCLDLRKPEALEVAWRLIAKSHVMVSSYRPGVTDRLGLGFDQVHERAPSLVYARVSGYGQEGPLSQRPGSDTILQATSGLMSQVGRPDEDPHRIGVPVVDVLAARDLVIGIVTALFATARGNVLPGPVDVSLFASALTYQSGVWQKYFEAGTVQRRAGQHNAGIAPAGLYRTSDGRQVAVAVLRDEHFVKFCDAVGRSELTSDERFRTNGARLENRAALEEVLVPAFAARTMAEWSDILLHHDVLAGPVTELPDIIGDEGLSAAMRLTRLPAGALGGEADAIGLPISFGSAPSGPDPKSPPSLGQHTREVLTEFGFGDTEIEELIRCGATPELEFPRRQP